MANLINGKQIAQDIRAEIAEEVKELSKQGICPGLAVILVGENPASKVYVRNKQKACEEVGIRSTRIDFPENVSEEELLCAIQTLNSDPAIHGILVQLPLPHHISEEKVIHAISPEKDVDAFHPVNVGKLVTGNPTFLPCTPAGVMELLRRSGIDPKGKECVIVGRSNIVGKPAALLMLAANATVTICHSKTQDLKKVCSGADILVAAIGKPDFITAEYVKKGAVVIDVGINRKEDGKLTGDVDFASVEPIASYITPVPGGVGPMTIAMLLRNTMEAAKNHKV